MSKDKKLKLPVKEIVWYSIAGFFGLVGLVFVIFGVLGSHLPLKDNGDLNWVLESENAWLVNWSKMGYRWWGLILLGVGGLIAIVSLTLFARVGDRDEERAARRAQRLALENEPVEVTASEEPAQEPAPEQ